MRAENGYKTKQRLSIEKTLREQIRGRKSGDGSVIDYPFEQHNN